MPLIKSKSEKAFKSNVSEMIKAGHPKDQSLAAAYSIKRKSKFAEGGTVSDKMISSLMAKRRKKLEADSDFNTSPDIGEQSREQSNQSKFDSKLSPEGTFDQREEALYAEGGPVDPKQSAQDSMRKAFHYAKGGDIAYTDINEHDQEDLKQGHDESTSYAEGGDVSAAPDVDEPKHDSLPYSKPPKEESSFYKPKAVGNQGRPVVDLNMYAPGGQVKMAYGQGRKEHDQEDTPEQKIDEVSHIAMAEGGIAYNANLKENYKYEPERKHDEISDIAYAEGGSVEDEKHLKPDMEDTKESKDEASSITMAEGGSVAHADHLEPDMVDLKQEHNEEHYSEPSDDDYGPDKHPEVEAYYAEGGSVEHAKHLEPDDEDTKESKDESSSIAMANGGPVQSKGHNPKSGENESEDESEMKKRRRKMMIESLNS